jgi:transcriptional regulator with XRE-family HTH domain
MREHMTPDEFRDWRKRLGLTQDEAAAELRVTERAVRRYEKGERKISVHVARLCEMLRQRLVTKRGPRKRAKYSMTRALHVGDCLGILKA